MKCLLTNLVKVNFGILAVGCNRWDRYKFATIHFTICIEPKVVPLVTISIFPFFPCLSLWIEKILL